jgi:hypothetical protein
VYLWYRLVKDVVERESEGVEGGTAVPEPSASAE